MDEIEEARNVPFKKLEQAWLRTNGDKKKQARLIAKHKLLPAMSKVRAGEIKLGITMKLDNGIMRTYAGLDNDNELIFITNNPRKIYYPSKSKANKRPEGQEYIGYIDDARAKAALAAVAADNRAAESMMQKFSPDQIIEMSSFKMEKEIAKLDLEEGTAHNAEVITALIEVLGRSVQPGRATGNLKASSLNEKNAKKIAQKLMAKLSTSNAEVYKDQLKRTVASFKVGGQKLQIISGGVSNKADVSIQIDRIDVTAEELKAPPIAGGMAFAGLKRSNEATEVDVSKFKKIVMQSTTNSFTKVEVWIDPNDPKRFYDKAGKWIGDTRQKVLNSGYKEYKGKNRGQLGK